MNLVRLSDRHAYREAKANCAAHGMSILPFRRWVHERIEDRAIEELERDLRGHADDYEYYGESRK
jgi:hypothetical protein